jgi:hypothetical protein
MGVRVVGDDSGEAFYCSTTGTAFGFVMASKEEALEFLDWLCPLDARWFSARELSDKIHDFYQQKEKTEKGFGRNCLAAMEKDEKL